MGFVGLSFLALTGPQRVILSLYCDLLLPGTGIEGKLLASGRAMIFVLVTRRTTRPGHFMHARLV